MKTLILLLLPTLLEAQPVSTCFHVNSLLKADSESYWANWSNNCPYTIDAVYVNVKFSPAGDGVWALHFIPPGARRVTRFTVPKEVLDFATVVVHKITTDMMEAFLKVAK